jgi:hypothetical protein
VSVGVCVSVGFVCVGVCGGVGVRVLGFVGEWVLECWRLGGGGEGVCGECVWVCGECERVCVSVWSCECWGVWGVYDVSV